MSSFSARVAGSFGSAAIAFFCAGRTLIARVGTKRSTWSAAIDRKVVSLLDDTIRLNDRAFAVWPVRNTHSPNFLSGQFGDFVLGYAFVPVGVLTIAVMVIDHDCGVVNVAITVPRQEVPMRMMGVEMAQWHVTVVERGQAPIEMDANAAVAVAESKAAPVARNRRQGSPTTVGV